MALIGTRRKGENIGGFDMRKSLVLLVALCVILAACEPPQNVARDALAANHGVLVTYQNKYQNRCANNPSMKPCRLIHEAVSAQNLAVDALDLYCQGITTPSFMDGGPCAPDKSAEPKLRAALKNLDVIMRDVKSLQ